jgi:hypothetical protein
MAKLAPGSDAAAAVLKEVNAAIPLGHMGRRWDIAMACVFLARWEGVCACVWGGCMGVRGAGLDHSMLSRQHVLLAPNAAAGRPLPAQRVRAAPLSRREAAPGAVLLKPAASS